MMVLRYLWERRASVLERYSKKIKVDVKIVSDHPYGWHSGPEQPRSKTKQLNRSGAAHNQENQKFLNKTKALVLI
jgi:hypothetical protein